MCYGLITHPLFDFMLQLLRDYYLLVGILNYEVCEEEGECDHHDGHIHFYCESCHRSFCMEDIHIPSFELPEGFYPHSVSFVIKGECPECRQKHRWKQCLFKRKRHRWKKGMFPARRPAGFEIISGWKIILGMLLYKVEFPFLRNPTSYSNMSEWSLTQIPTINNH